MNLDLRSLSEDEVRKMSSQPKNLLAAMFHKLLGQDSLIEESTQATRRMTRVSEQNQKGVNVRLAQMEEKFNSRITDLERKVDQEKKRALESEMFKPKNVTPQDSKSEVQIKKEAEDYTNRIQKLNRKLDEQMDEMGAKISMMRSQMNEKIDSLTLFDEMFRRLNSEIEKTEAKTKASFEAMGI